MTEETGMKKSFTIFSFIFTLALAASSFVSVSAEDKVNMLATKSDWSVFEENQSILTIEDRVMSITPTTTDAGATYISNSYKNATIEFNYQITYDVGVEPYDQDDDLMPGSFWGIIFGNQVTVDDSWAGVNVLPWKVPGGYPYMLCFDTERQTTDETSGRYTQVGLSLRRYKEDGSHAYDARWSTVDPGDFEYMTSVSKLAKSITPKFSKPVTVTDCFDTDQHSVKLDYCAQYVSMGAESDAIVINVWFDEELVLTVEDTMPFKSEKWGVTVDVDKRDENGYIGVMAHHASVSDAQLYDWEVDISNLTVTDKGAVSSTAGDDTDSGSKGCGGSIAASGGIALLPLCAAAFVMKKKSGEKK